MAVERTGGSETGNTVVFGEELEELGTSGSPDGDDGEGRIPIVEPESIAFEPSESEQRDTGPKRRGGRPKGSRNTSSRARKEEASDIADILQGCHAMLSVLCKIPELELSDEESAKLGKALDRVNELHGGVVLSPKARAWINLGFAGAAVYGPRLAAYGLRTAKEKEEKKHRRTGPQTIDGFGQVI